MEDWLKCQISSLVKYRQNQNQIIQAYSLQEANTDLGTSHPSTQVFLKFAILLFNSKTALY